MGTTGCQRECQKIRRLSGGTQWSVPHQKEDRLSGRKVKREEQVQDLGRGVLSLAPSAPTLGRLLPVCI